MPTKPADLQRTEALQRHLRDNASDLIGRNIIVHVDSISHEHGVAFCSVEQRHKGLLRRDRSVDELVWRAEQALAPLIGLGFVPMITARHKSLHNATAAPAAILSRNVMDRMPDLWRWLGSPFRQEGFGDPTLVKDPFGWRQARLVSIRK
jgi:hypothetical protein